MTLTTVGYGELSPSTFPGKLIGRVHPFILAMASSKARKDTRIAHSKVAVTLSVLSLGLSRNVSFSKLLNLLLMPKNTH